MKYLMLTYSSEEGADKYDQQSEAERAADRQRHVAWFSEHAAALGGGYELSWPRVGGVVRSGSAPLVLDGPFVESKEMLGGIIVLEADNLEAALSIGASWPSLEIYPGSRVDVIAVAESSQ